MIHDSILQDRRRYGVLAGALFYKLSCNLNFYVVYYERER